MLYSSSSLSHLSFALDAFSSSSAASSSSCFLLISSSYLTLALPFHLSMSLSLPMNFSSFHPCSRSLLALSVFQDLRNAEYIRSIHLYHQNGTVFTIQQEFLLKPGAFSQISPPISSACFCSLPSSGLKHFMLMLRKMHEGEWWKCVLEFSSDSPNDTAIIPLLSASRNPDLQTIPSLAEDLRLVEIAVSDRTFSHVSFSDDGETSDGCRDAALHHKHASNWPYLYWSLPATSNSLPVDVDNERGAESLDRIPQSPPLDLWQKWGSDLELASPRLSQRFSFTLRRNGASDASMPAAISTSSPTSSCFSSQNADSSSWSTEKRSSQAGVSTIEEIGGLAYMVRSGDEFREANDGSSAISNDPDWGSGDHRRKLASSERSKHSRRSTERLTELSLNELSQYFNMPITQASKELQVGLTVLKKRCREFGIPRWPHRKMKSLESLIHNIKDLTRDEEGNDTSRVLYAVKELEEQKKTMEDKPATELAERTKRLRQACFKANYKKRRQQQAQTTSQEEEEEEEQEEEEEEEEEEALDDYNYNSSNNNYNSVFPLSLIPG